MLPILVCVVDTIKMNGNCSSFCQPNVRLWLWWIANKFIILQFTLYLPTYSSNAIFHQLHSFFWQFSMDSRFTFFMFSIQFYCRHFDPCHCIGIGNALRWDSAMVRKKNTVLCVCVGCVSVTDTSRLLIFQRTAFFIEFTSSYEFAPCIINQLIKILNEMPLHHYTVHILLFLFCYFYALRLI